MRPTRARGQKRLPAFLGRTRGFLAQQDAQRQDAQRVYIPARGRLGWAAVSILEQGILEAIREIRVARPEPERSPAGVVDPGPAVAIEGNAVRMEPAVEQVDAVQGGEAG